MVSRSIVRVAATTLVAGALCWGGAAALTPQPAEAALVGGFATVASAGEVIGLGAYDAVVPFGLTAYEAAGALSSPDSSQGLACSWTLVTLNTVTESLAPRGFVLASTPYTTDSAIATPQTVAEAQACSAALGEEFALGDSATYLGTLSCGTSDNACELAFFIGSNLTSEGAIIVGYTVLPPTDEVEAPTLCAVAVSAQRFGTVLPALDQLFSTIEVALPDAERAAETLRAYQAERGY